MFKNYPNLFYLSFSFFICISCCLTACLPEIDECYINKMDNTTIVNTNWQSDTIEIKTNKRTFNFIPDSIILNKTSDYSHTLILKKDTLQISYQHHFICSNKYKEYLDFKITTPSKTLQNSYLYSYSFATKTNYNILGKVIYYRPDPTDSIEVIYDVKIKLTP